MFLVCSYFSWFFLKKFHNKVMICNTRNRSYLCYKTIFCNKVALDVWLINCFIWRKNVSFLRYLDFCVFAKSTDFKICDVIIGIPTYIRKLRLRLLSTIEMNFCQMLVCCMANISNVFLPQCWRLETTSRYFYYFIKMTI